MVVTGGGECQNVVDGAALREAKPQRMLFWCSEGETKQMFLGEYTHALDSKGRLTIPLCLRAELGATVVVTRGYEACLVVYPLDAWAALARKIAQVSATNAVVRSYSRLFFGGAHESQPDRMGRIRVPAFLRDYAGLEIEKEAVIVGANTCAEIWNPDRYRQTIDRDTQDLPQVLANLAQMGV
jgi:MraZ protein